MLNKKSIVTVIGGSGFVGIYVVRKLAGLGVRIQVISRNAQLKAGQLRTIDKVGQIALINCDVNDLAKLETHISKSDYVVNLVGIKASSGKLQSFESLHQSFPLKLASLCTKHKIKKLIHISALGVGDATDSEYAQTKLAGEQALLNHFDNTVILRPSVIFGPEDKFINMFNFISKIFLVIPCVAPAATIFQPIYVDDVAQAVAAMLMADADTNASKVIEIAGPKKYNFKQIIEAMLAASGRKRFLITMPNTIMNVIALFASMLPNPLVTPDQLRLLKHNNFIIGINGLDAMGIKATAMEDILPSYID